MTIAPARQTPCATQRRRSPRLISTQSDVITTISDLRRYFRGNTRPIYFVSGTDFNLAGMDEWIGNFRHVCYIDSYDGRHPGVFVPHPARHPEFQSLPDVVNYLLRNDEVRQYITGRGGAPIGVFLMFDEETEELCRELGMEVWFPDASLRCRCDSKVETVRIGNRAGVPSVPNVLGRARDYSELRRLASAAGLGRHLVVQTPYGDSGHTTFFISNRNDWSRHAAEIVAEDEVKIMRRIEPLGSTLEACVTRCGTVVGPLLTELIGKPELTPYAGGWCGNELYADAFTEDVRTTARSYAEKVGDQLLREGYTGYFDLDFLIDPAGRVYLGELNPRVCGASPLTNHAAFAHADVPLFLFHMLEFSGADYDLDIGELNGRWADPRYIDSWSLMVLKSTSPEVDVVTSAPPSGLYAMEDGAAVYKRFEHRRGAVESERDGLFLRITGPGDYRYEGADLGILMTRGQLMTGEFDLNDTARRWIDGLLAYYRTSQSGSLVRAAPAASPFKIM